ncbi:MAG TPA: ABC transporter ATP-binding protein, partial [bacterium]|nr:ABC transporter ATP-binding protein [bacterium]
MIRVEHLHKSYDRWAGPRALALDDLSFHVPAGHIAGLVGKNGAGKSTTLKILSGQLLPSSGEVWVEGFPVSTQPLEVRRRIGFLPETPPLYPEMTVTGYLVYAARLRGVAGRQAGARVREVMERLGLVEVARERLRALSRGFQQRVGIAQAIVHGPSVVLLDEPMAGLDPLQIVQTRELVRSLKPQHTVLFSSHILGEIASLCDSILLLDGGRLKAQGT